MPKRGYGGCFFIVVGSLFALFGMVVLVVLARDTIETFKTYSWEKAPAQLQNVEIEYPNKAPSRGASGVFELKASYTYVVDGEEQQGTSLRRHPVRSNDYQELADQKANLIQAEVQHVFVSPDDPRSSIVYRESRWTSLFLLVPFIFVLVGLTIVAASLGWFNSLGHGLARRRVRSSERSKPRRLLFLLGGGFLFAGLCALYFIAIQPMMWLRGATHWQETPCRIIWSRVVVHDSDEGDNTYSPDVFYEYQFEGETYRSNRFSFVSMSTNNHKKHADLVGQYPAGKEAECFVNPQTPWHAILKRDISQIGFWWIFPIPFIAVGVFLLYLASGKMVGID